MEENELQIITVFATGEAGGIDSLTEYLKEGLDEEEILVVTEDNIEQAADVVATKFKLLLSTLTDNGLTRSMFTLTAPIKDLKSTSQDIQDKLEELKLDSLMEYEFYREIVDEEDENYSKTAHEKVEYTWAFSPNK